MKTPKFWYKDKSSLKYIFYPLSALWLIGVYLKKNFIKPKKFKVPVICVGNIISGGSGKTPLTIELAKLFLKKNFVVHVVKKQYKCKNTQALILVNEKSEPLIVGDEPILISKIATTWLVKNRKVGIEHAIKKGANLIILDDGYQDFSIIKDYTILTINQMQQFGNKSIIPAGPLREKISGIQRADSIFYYGNMGSLDPIILNSSKPITYAKLAYDTELLKKVKNKNILAFAGIAHPENFFISVMNYGFNLVKKIEYPDHYRYKKKDFKKIILMSKKFKLTVFTTEKDYVKVPKEFKNKILPIPLIVQFNQDDIYNLFIRKVKKNA